MKKKATQRTRTRASKRKPRAAATKKPALSSDDLPPTVGELDLHLFGEGKHEEIYRKLGAHVTNLGNTSGVAFAVWAPQAASVGVVGDFNSWNGSAHQMRR